MRERNKGKQQVIKLVLTVKQANQNTNKEQTIPLNFITKLQQ